MKLTGSNAHAYLGFYNEDNIIGTGSSTKPGTFYFILDRDEDRGLLEYFPAGTFFKSPASGTQITLKTNDRFLELDLMQVYKTSADFSMEQGTVDVGDDGDPGAQILDGIVSVSGSISGLFRYDENTGEFDDMTHNVINHFLPVIEDEGNGTYIRHSRDDSKVFLLVLLNGNAKAGQIENWLFVPINISSMSMSLGNTDAQNRDLSWSKAEGEAVKYSVPKVA